jgi:hypothetical protein
MKSQYRIEPYDVVNDIWLLQKRAFWFFWRDLGVGGRKVLLAKIAELEDTV